MKCFGYIDHTMTKVFYQAYMIASQSTILEIFTDIHSSALVHFENWGTAVSVAAVSSEMVPLMMRNPFPLADTTE